MGAGGGWKFTRLLRLYLNEDQQINLDFFFVDPDFIERGRDLMRDFLKRVRNSAYEKFFLHADPQAEGFYKHFGFKSVSQLKSSIPDSYLPIMELKLGKE